MKSIINCIQETLDKYDLHIIYISSPIYLLIWLTVLIIGIANQNYLMMNLAVGFIVIPALITLFSGIIALLIMILRKEK